MIRKSTGLPGYCIYCKKCQSYLSTTYPRKKYSKEEQNIKAKVWRDKNRDKDRLRVAMRRKIAIQATPPYITKEDLAPYYTEAISKGLTVDHIIPLKHPLVCGLNVPWNLQLLSREENSSKGNSFNP